MSGVKGSELRLQRERAEKLRLVQDLRNLHSEIGSLHERIEVALANVSSGVLSTFPDEVQQARQWMALPSAYNISQFDMDAALVGLRSAQVDLTRTAQSGRQVHETLTIAFTQKKDVMGQQLSRRLAELESRYVARRQLLQLWFGEETIRNLERALESNRQQLAAEQYASLRNLLDRAEQELASRVKQVEAWEDKHQKRLYLLKALRKVCEADMGFVKMAEPCFEHPGQRGSRILYKVDTLDRGRIDFTLSLDGISSFSEITDDLCFEDFAQLSHYLEDEYGIETEFRHVEGEPPPKLIRKGELDLPDDAARQATA